MGVLKRRERLDLVALVAAGGSSGCCDPLMLALDTSKPYAVEMLLGLSASEFVSDEPERELKDRVTERGDERVHDVQLSWL